MPLLQDMCPDAHTHTHTHPRKLTLGQAHMLLSPNEKHLPHRCECLRRQARETPRITVAMVLDSTSLFIDEHTHLVSPKQLAQSKFSDAPEKPATLHPARFVHSFCTTPTVFPAAQRCLLLSKALLYSCSEIRTLSQPTPTHAKTHTKGWPLLCTLLLQDVAEPQPERR